MKKMSIFLAISLVLTAHAMKRAQPDLEVAEQPFVLGNMPIEVKTHIMMMFAKSQTLQEAIDGLKQLINVNKEFHAVINGTQNTKHLIAMLVAKFGGKHESIARSLATSGAQEYVKKNTELLQAWRTVKSVDDALKLLERTKKDGSIDINYRDNQGDTALLVMVKRASLKDKNTLSNFLGGKIATTIVALLIQNHADVNITNGIYTPLMLALESGNIPMAENILHHTTQEFIDFRQEQGQGQTALMVALDTDNVEIIQELIKWGANVSITDSHGRTVIDHLRDNMQASLESDEEEDSDETRIREQILAVLEQAKIVQEKGNTSQTAEKE